MQHHPRGCLLRLMLGHGGQVGYFFGVPKAPVRDAHGTNGQCGAREEPLHAMPVLGLDAACQTSAVVEQRDGLA